MELIQKLKEAIKVLKTKESHKELMAHERNDAETMYRGKIIRKQLLLPSARLTFSFS